MHIFIYNGKSSQDFGLAISGEDTWGKAKPDVTRTKVPGRNGDLLTLNQRYDNVDITYHVGIRRRFGVSFDAFMSFLLSDPGYHRLEDSYHPDHYRLAFVENEVKPKPGARNYDGIFDLKFTCKPQLFLKSGERMIEFTANGSIFNPTLFPAKPLLRVYGTGQVGIGGETFHITAADGYTDIDCDLEDAYKGTANKNGCLQLSSGEFPTLAPGDNGITLGSGITKVEITPRWWSL